MCRMTRGGIVWLFEGQCYVGFSCWDVEHDRQVCWALGPQELSTFMLCFFELNSFNFYFQRVHDSF